MLASASGWQHERKKGSSSSWRYWSSGVWKPLVEALKVRGLDQSGLKDPGADKPIVTFRHHYTQRTYGLDGCSHLLARYGPRTDALLHGLELGQHL